MSPTSKAWELDDFDPSWPQFVAEPHPFYGRLREEEPVHFVRSTGCFWVTSYPEVVRVLADPRFGREPPTRQTQPLPQDLKRIEEIPANMIYLNPPEHSRVRSLANIAFERGLIEDLRSSIATTAKSLLDELGSRHRIDMISEFASPLPMIVIADLLGVSRDGYDKVKDWSGRIIRGLDETQPPEAHLDSIRARIEFVDYLGEVLNGADGGVLLRRLVDAELEGDRLTRNELLSMCVLLLIGGQENTTNVLGCGLLELVRHDDQLTMLRDDPRSMRSAVEELLRYVSPVQRTVRFALEDLTLGDKLVEKGQGAMAVIGSANRDPSVFPNPDDLDIHRDPNQHVAFGRGIHHCLGAPLARLELAIGFGEFLRRFKHVRVAAEPEWKQGSAVRGLRSLQLEV